MPEGRPLPTDVVTACYVCGDTEEDAYYKDLSFEPKQYDVSLGEPTTICIQCREKQASLQALIQAVIDDPTEV